MRESTNRRGAGGGRECKVTEVGGGSEGDGAGCGGRSGEGRGGGEWGLMGLGAEGARGWGTEEETGGGTDGRTDGRRQGGGGGGPDPVAVGAVALGVEPVEDGGGELEVLQVVFEEGVEARPLHLDGHVLAPQHRAVHLPPRRGGWRGCRVGVGGAQRLGSTAPARIRTGPAVGCAGIGAA